MIRIKYFREALMLGGALSCMMIGVNQAQAADAFGIAGQSAYFDGMSNAGSAAGGDISSMYWNPAATATKPGFNTSSNFTAAFISVPEHATGGVQTLFGGRTDTDVGQDGFPLSSFSTLQLTDRIYAGLAINAPFGLTTKSDSTWVGSSLATTSKILSYDFNPTVAYKLTPEITIGAGVQFLFVKTKLDHGAGGVIPAPATFEAQDWSLGATAGILWQPREGTSIGLGYRSRVDMDLHGTFKGLSPFQGLVNTSVNASLPLPDQVTLSARQNVTARLAILGTVEWQNWSRLGDVAATNGLPVPVNVQHFNYQDRWSYSVGAEYVYSPALTLRAGVGFDRSPVTDSVRDIAVPDSDDVHVSIGASYRFSDKLTFDVSYSHFFFDDAPFCIGSPAAGTTHCVGQTVLLSGNASPELDAVSLGVKYKWGESAQLEPFK